MGLARAGATAVPVRERRREPDTRRSTLNRTSARLDHPSRRYLVHLNAPGWNVIGATAPWLPGVAVGHNDRVALGHGRDRRRHTGPVRREGEPVESASGRGRRPMGRHEDRHGADRHPRQPEAVHIRAPSTPATGSSSRRSRTPSGVRPPVERQRAGRRRAAGGAGAEPRVIVAGVHGRASRAGRCRRGESPMPMPTAGANRWSAASMPVRRGWNGALPAPGWLGANEWTGWQTPDAANGGEDGRRHRRWRARARASRSR